MNYSLIKAMVLKDWYLARWPMLGYFSVGVISLLTLASGTTTGFYIGFILCLSTIVVIGVHLIFTTVVGERKDQTLAFMMSFPVSYKDYTLSKLATNLIGFIVPWFVLTFGSVIVIFSSDGLSDGLVPFVTISLGEVFVANVLVLTIAIITESEAWTIVVMATCNICASLFSFLVTSFPEIVEHMEGDVPVWNSTVKTMLSIEITLVVLLLAAIFYAQSRKRDFT
ncbi:MAG: ABC-2 transporter permease [Kangiellaceae bacterium]|nr:ABC-2 transporter permease [Kangiellaceae bacterium]